MPRCKDVKALSTHKPSFSKVAALGRVRLLTNSSSLKAEGLVALQQKGVAMQWDFPQYYLPHIQLFTGIENENLLHFTENLVTMLAGTDCAA